MIRAWSCALLLLLALAVPAGAVDVSQLSDFESDPCFIALSERNVGQHVDAPDNALAEACERAHGSVEVAWDFLTRVWLPRDAATGQAVRPAAPVGPVAVAAMLLEFLLTYVVLANPVWAVAALLRGGAGPAPRRLAVEGALCLVLRLLLAASLLALLRLPVVAMLAAVLLVAAVAWRLRGGGRAPAAPADGPAPGAFAVVLAGLVNDAAAAAAGLLALALAARGHALLLGGGVLLSVVFAPPAVLHGLLRLRRAPIAYAAAGALFAACLGMLAAPPGGVAVSTAVPVVCAGLVLWQAWAGGRLSARGGETLAQAGTPSLD